MKILNQGDLYLSEGLFNVLSKDNKIAERLNFSEDNQLQALYKYYKEKKWLVKFMEILDTNSISNLYAKFKDELDELN